MKSSLQYFAKFRQILGRALCFRNTNFLPNTLLFSGSKALFLQAHFQISARLFRKKYSLLRLQLGICSSANCKPLQQKHILDFQTLQCHLKYLRAKCLAVGVVWLGLSAFGFADEFVAVVEAINFAKHCFG